MKDRNGNYIGPYRAWDFKANIGIATSRSIGDNCLKKAGVSSLPGKFIYFIIIKKIMYMI